MSDSEQGSPSRNKLQQLKVKLQDLHLQYTAQKGYKAAHKDLMGELHKDYQKAVADGSEAKTLALQEQIKGGEARATRINDELSLLEKEMGVIQSDISLRHLQQQPKRELRKPTLPRNLSGHGEFPSYLLFVPSH